MGGLSIKFKFIPLLSGWCSFLTLSHMDKRQNKQMKKDNFRLNLKDKEQIDEKKRLHEVRCLSLNSEV